MLAQMPAGLLAEWAAYDRIDPISLGYRIDVETGILGSILANANRDPKARKTPFTMEELMPKWEPAPEKTPDELWKQLKAWAVLNG